MADDDGVQSDQDQGANDAPYAEYLNRIPEEFRGDVEPVFKEWDANVTRRFQESAEQRKQWEPYQQVVGSANPDAVKWGLDFYQALESPQAIKQWYETYATQNGLSQEEAEEEFASFDQIGDDSQQFERMLQKQLGPVTQQLQELSEWREAREFETRRQSWENVIRGQLDEIKEKNPDVYNEKAIEGFAAQYIESDPEHAIQRGFDDWKGVVGQLEAQTLQRKVDNSMPAETGGVPDGAAEPITTLAQAALAAREQLRGSRG